MNSSEPFAIAGTRKKCRRYVAAVVFEASDYETAVHFSDRMREVIDPVWVSSPGAADQAYVYEALEIRLLGDGDLIVVTPEKSLKTCPNVGLITPADSPLP